MKILFLFLACAAAAPAACGPVAGGRILGRDLAQVDPQFSALPSSLQVGSVPAPGEARTLTVEDLERLARRNGVRLIHPTALCFETPVHAPTDREFLDAMRRSLPDSAAVKISDRSKAPVPSGRIDFPIASLGPPGRGGTQLWRGFVQYAATRRTPVWALVSVAEQSTSVVAAHDLPVDTPLAASDLRLETRTGPPVSSGAATRVADVAGRALRLPLKSGAEVRLSVLEDAPAFRRGQTVSVEVRSGRAVLRLDAIAQSNVRNGQTAEFRNPSTGRLFRAEVRDSVAIVIVGKRAPL